MTVAVASKLPCTAHVVASETRAAYGGMAVARGSFAADVAVAEVAVVGAESRPEVERLVAAT